MAPTRLAIALVSVTLAALCGCHDDGARAPDQSAPARSSASSTTEPADSTVPPEPSSTLDDRSDPPMEVETQVGTWTRVADSSTILRGQAVPTSIPGPQDGNGGAWPTYEIDGDVVALGTLDGDAGIDDDVHLAVWHLDGPGTWTLTGTGPPMPAYRMRYSALLSIEPILRDRDILLLDAAGNLISVSPDGAITSAGVPRPPGPDAVGPSDQVQNIAASRDAILVVGGGADIAMWRTGWDAWRTFQLPVPPSDMPGAMAGPVQVRAVGDDFYVDVLANGVLTPWRLSRPS